MPRRIQRREPSLSRQRHRVDLHDAVHLAGADDGGHQGQEVPLWCRQLFALGRAFRRDCGVAAGQRSVRGHVARGYRLHDGIGDRTDQLFALRRDQVGHCGHSRRQLCRGGNQQLQQRCLEKPDRRRAQGRLDGVCPFGGRPDLAVLHGLAARPRGRPRQGHPGDRTRRGC